MGQRYHTDISSPPLAQFVYKRFDNILLCYIGAAKKQVVFTKLTNKRLSGWYGELAYLHTQQSNSFIPLDFVCDHLMKSNIHRTFSSVFGLINVKLSS